MCSIILRNFLLEESCTHTCVKALEAKAFLLVGYAYASVAHILFCVAGFMHNLVPFLNQAFVKEVLEVLKSSVYIHFYLLPGLIELLIELLAMGACTCVKCIVLLLEIVCEKLQNLCSLRKLHFSRINLKSNMCAMASLVLLSEYFINPSFISHNM